MSRHANGLLRTRVGMLSGLRRKVMPVTVEGFIAPTCVLCNRPLDGEELVEAPSGKGFVRVLGRHHGAEELAQFEMGTEHHTPEDLNRAMRSHPWFAPDVEKGAVNDS